MKKIIVLLMVALLAFALVACGGDSATTTKTTEASQAETTAATTGVDTAVTTEAGQVTTPATAETTAPIVTTTVKPGTDTQPTVVTTQTPGEDETPEGVDILFGEYEYAAIDPTWNGIWPCAFENHQPDFNYKWCLVFKMYPTDEFVQENLIVMDDTIGFGEALLDYVWTVTINDQKFVIDHFSIPQRDGFIYVRMGLGDWAPEIGEHEYEVRLDITDAYTGSLVYYANFTDDEWGGTYIYNGPEPTTMIPALKPEGIIALPAGSLVGISGPESLAAAETYARLYDGEVRSKLCSSDYTNPIIFTLNNDVTATSFKGISLVGANDDEKFNERVVLKFKVYGSDNGESWNSILSVDDSNDPGTIANYAERYYAFEDAVEYRYYKIEITDASGAATPKYQFSEILLYTDAE